MTDMAVTVDEYQRAELEFVACVSEINADTCRSLDARLQKLNQEILEHEEVIEILKAEPAGNSVLMQIGSLHLDNVKLRGQINNLCELRRIASPSEDELKVQFGIIWETPGIRAVCVMGRQLVYRTHPLFGKDHTGAWRRIGPFEISFSLENPILDSFIWKNLDGPKDEQHGPPNICESSYTEYGSVQCAGDAQSVIDAAHEIKDYPALVAFSIRYPECAGTPQNGTIMKWPRVAACEVPTWYIEQFGL